MSADEVVCCGDNRWIDIQMVENEVWVHSWSFISTPRKYIDIFSKELS